MKGGCEARPSNVPDMLGISGIHVGQGVGRGSERLHIALSCPGHRPQAPGPTRGFSLVAVLFLIVVVAALGAFAVRIGAGQQQTVNLALMGARALSAANSGIEYGAARAFDTGGSVCASSTALTLTGPGLNGFSVDVTCVPTTHTDPDNTTTYRIGATAYWGTYGQPDYVSRQVFATFSSVL